MNVKIVEVKRLMYDLIIHLKMKKPYIIAKHVVIYIGQINIEDIIFIKHIWLGSPIKGAFFCCFA